MFSTPRPSPVTKSKGFGTPRERLTLAPWKYVSPMAKAREEKKRREAEGKEWQGLSDMESSSNPSTGSVASDASSAATRNAGPDMLKFGEWEKHSVNSGPYYTLLFQNAALIAPGRLQGSMWTARSPGMRLLVSRALIPQAQSARR
jgi:hypothetical protein